MMGFVGCSCNEEETADEKYLRLYDINQNQEIDDWEKPFNYGEYNGVSYTGRQFVDSNGNVINSEDIHYIDSTNDFGQFFTNKEIEVVDEEDPTKKHKETIVVPNVANNVFMFRNGTYFDRSQDVISASVGARAYIVEISRLEELEKFAKMNLTNTDNDKYILSLTSDISFRTGESNGNPLAVFSSPKLINLNGASIYGNGKTIEGFVLNPNNDAFLYKPNQTIKSEKGEYDDKVSTVNLKYSLISNATAVYDLNIHVGYNNIVIEPTTGTETAQYNMYIDVAPLRNAVVVDNVMVRGKIDITTKVTKTSIGVDNSNITVAGVNVSMLCISEDLTARNNKIYVGEDVTKVTQFVPYDMREDERYSDIAEEDRHYDYDRLIMTQRVLQNQEDGTAYPEKEAYKHYEDKYVYYNTLRDNLSVTNCNVEGYIDYQEYSKESSSSSGNIVYTYNDSAFAVNIGGIYANPFDAYYLTKNCNSDIDVNLKTGASCNIGGIASYLYIGAFVENCTSDINVNLQPISNINTTIKNTNNIGGIAGGVVFNSEVKNCESKMSFDSSVLENEALVATNNLAVGGVVGVNHGLVVSCKTVIEKMSAVNYDIVTMGGIAGSSYGGVFVKNIAKVGVMLEEATQAGIIIKDATHSYTGAVVGSIIGGTIRR